MQRWRAALAARCRTADGCSCGIEKRGGSCKTGPAEELSCACILLLLKPLRGNHESQHCEATAGSARTAARAPQARGAVAMNRPAADVGPQRLRAAVAETHVGIWVAVIASVLICAIIAWLHFQQRDTFQRAMGKVDSLLQSRIDLAQAFL